MIEKLPEDNQKKISGIRRVTLTGMVINVFLSAGKLILGILYSCQALIADGVHSISDLATDLAVIIGVRYWSAPPDKSHPYGHAKIETIFTAVIGLALGAVGVIICWEALEGIFSAKKDEYLGLPVLIMALLSILSKEILYQWTKFRARMLGSPALEANAWHHRSDAFSSIPVAIAIFIANIFPSWQFVDEIGALIVSGFILYSAWGILKPTLFELTDSSIQGDKINEIRNICNSFKDVKDVHAIRARQFGSQIQVDLHILVKPSMTILRGHQITKEIQSKLLDSDLGIADTVIHIEPNTEEEKRESETAL